VKILKYILLVIVLLVSEKISLSQYYLKVKSDSICLESDSVLLYLDEYRGTINWQTSSDLTTWITLNKIDDTLSVRIDSSGYYMAILTEGTCIQVMSDTIFLIEKITITGSNRFTVDSLGGVFLLPSGIKVKIPKGAVTELKEIQVDFLGFEDVNGLSAIDIPENASFLTGLSIATDLFNFRKPIKLKIPIQGIDLKGLPVLRKLQSESNSWGFSDETMIVSPVDSFIEIVLKGSDQKGTPEKGASDLSLNDIRSFFLELFGDIFLSEDPCKEEIYTVVTKDVDYDNSGGCVVINAKQEIAYLNCDPVKVEPFSTTEISPSCFPELNISPLSLKIKEGESGSVILAADIGKLPLSEQEIKVTTSTNLYSSNPVIFTSSDGDISFSVQGIEVGEGVVSLSVLFKYYLTTIYAESNGQIYKGESDLKEITKDYTISVIVSDIPTVLTTAPSYIDCESATIGGIVIADNFDPVTECGVIFGGLKLQAGGVEGPFSFKIGVAPNAVYSYVAYATNLAGTSYGNHISFTTSSGDECYDASEVSTTPVTDITCSTASFGGYVRSDGAQPITDRGVYWGTSQNPELTGSKLQIGSGTGPFSSKLSGLNPNITYYVKAYASNNSGSVYGDEVNFIIVRDSITDSQGNVYKTVTIGTQVWMTENLRNTASLPNVTDDYTWRFFNGPAYCWYNYDIAYKNEYGALYNWAAVMTGNLCPVGWHVPTDSEWSTLTNYLGGLDIAGGKLKETGLIHWKVNIGATNETCFTALPGGAIGPSSTSAGFERLGQDGLWWTSSVSPTVYEDYYDVMYCAWARHLTNYYGNVSREESFQVSGLSVRCIKD